MLRDIMPASAGPEEPLHTTNVMLYELGSLTRCLVRMHHRTARGVGDEGTRALKATARIELADLLTQVRLLAEQMGWDMIGLENDGMERFKERMSEIRKDEV
jgi:NTP pyrophosphatase (non-canonical NTP hydrolase)